MTPTERASRLAAARGSPLALGALVAPTRLRVPVAPMHVDWLRRQVPPWFARDRNLYYADAAPRGHAKSTIETFLRPLHDIVFGRESFIGIVSATESQANSFTRALWDALKSDAAQAWFPGLRVKGGISDFVAYSPHGPPYGTRVLALSIGQQVRSYQHAGWRFTSFILDDIETLGNVSTHERRAKVAEYVGRDVLFAGSQVGAKYTLHRAVGTILHPASWLAGALASPAWQGRAYRAMVRWPRHPDRWEGLRRIWGDLSIPQKDREAAIDKEHGSRPEWYDEGAEVIWPEGNSCLELHRFLWRFGRWMFDAELQNDPKASIDALFDVDAIKRFSLEGAGETLVIRRSVGTPIRVRDCSLSIWLDPIPPQGTGDYAAIAVVARDKHGGRYVLECQLFRDSPTMQVQRVLAARERWRMAGRIRLGYEDNGFAAVFGELWDMAQRKVQDASPFPAMGLARFEGQTSTESKEVRIARLQPAFWHGHLQLASDIDQAVVSQIRDFPGGTHDDGIDAIERADRALDTIGLSGSFGIV